MHTLKIRFQEIKPALSLFYLSFMGCLCVMGVQIYLDLKIEPLICLCSMGIIFGIYTSNRFTDTAEDFTNDISKLLFFQKKRIFFALAIASLVASFGILMVREKLNWLYLLLLAIGMSYSFRLIPWYSRERGWVMLRIKEITFIKNLAVSFLWGSSVFAVPILYASSEIPHKFTLLMLGVGLFLSTFNNTLFDDVMDEAGDRVAGIKTLPTTVGPKSSIRLLMGLDLLWLVTVAACFAASCFDAHHAAFLWFLGLYPFLYMGLNATGRVSKNWVALLAESDLLFFGLGLILLRTA